MIRILAVVRKASSEVVEFVALEDRRYPILQSFLDAAYGAVAAPLARPRLVPALRRFGSTDHRIAGLGPPRTYLLRPRSRARAFSRYSSAVLASPFS